jgi:hypothetical protein
VETSDFAAAGAPDAVLVCADAAPVPAAMAAPANAAAVRILTPCLVLLGKGVLPLWERRRSEIWPPPGFTGTLTLPDPPSREQSPRT